MINPKFISVFLMCIVSNTSSAQWWWDFVDSVDVQKRITEVRGSLHHDYNGYEIKVKAGDSIGFHIEDSVFVVTIRYTDVFHGYQNLLKYIDYYENIFKSVKGFGQSDNKLDKIFSHKVFVMLAMSLRIFEDMCIKEKEDHIRITNLIRQIVYADLTACLRQTDDMIFEYINKQHLDNQILISLRSFLEERIIIEGNMIKKTEGLRYHKRWAPYDFPMLYYLSEFIAYNHLTELAVLLEVHYINSKILYDGLSYLSRLQSNLARLNFKDYQKIQLANLSKTIEGEVGTAEKMECLRKLIYFDSQDSYYMAAKFLLDKDSLSAGLPDYCRSFRSYAFYHLKRHIKNLPVTAGIKEGNLSNVAWNAIEEKAKAGFLDEVYNWMVDNKGNYDIQTIRKGAY